MRNNTDRPNHSDNTTAKGETMMHGHGMEGGDGTTPADLFMMKIWEEIWEDLTDDQKTQLIGRMIDAKIQMKENLIEHMKSKIETFRMVRDFLCD